MKAKINSEPSFIAPYAILHQSEIPAEQFNERIEGKKNEHFI
jgi:hypothetical protein